jgi:hypothetical protein
MSEHSVSVDAAARGWGELADAWIRTYARTNRQFISEECTRAACAGGLALPPDPRAWGSPFRRAARDGIIRRVGYAQSPQRHLSPTVLWRSAVYGGIADPPEQTDAAAVP